MPLSLRDFVGQVQEEVTFRYKSYSRVEKSMDWAFAQWVLELFFPVIDTDQAFNQLIRNTAWDVDAYHRDDESGTVYLIRAIYGDPANDAKYGALGLLASLADTYHAVYDSLTSSPPELPDWIEVARAVAEGYRLSIILAVFGELDEAVDAEAFAADNGLPDGALLCRDIHQLRRISAGQDLDAGDESVVISFLDCVTYNGPVEAVVGNARAVDIRTAIASLVPQVYDANLRVPLGRTKINRQMKDTLTSPARRFFWYYNNGITVLCRAFRPLRDNENTFEILSPRIVNGAQTTDTILSVEASQLSQVDVMVRLIAALPGSEQVSSDLATAPGVLEDLHLDIARFTNSQNPIETPDFRSNEMVQKTLHREFIDLGWFYEHRRGQWENSPDQAIYHGKKIQMVELAQRWYAFAGNPAVAIRQRRSLFEEEGPYRSIFMLARSAEEFLVAYLVFEYLLEGLQANIGKAKAEESRVREVGGKLSIATQNYLRIGRATKLAAAHMSALIGRALEARLGPLNRNRAQQILVALQDGRLVKAVYPELEDTLVRFASQLRSDKGETLHSRLSEADTMDELYGLFEYVVEKEKDKGRDVFSL